MRWWRDTVTVPFLLLGRMRWGEAWWDPTITHSLKTQSKTSKITKYVTMWFLWKQMLWSIEIGRQRWNVILGQACGLLGGDYSIKEQKKKKLLSPGNSSSWCLIPLAQTPIPVPAQLPFPVQIADNLKGGRSSSGSWCPTCQSITAIGCGRASVLTHYSSRRETGSHQGSTYLKWPTFSGHTNFLTILECPQTSPQYEVTHSHEPLFSVDCPPWH